MHIGSTAFIGIEIASTASGQQVQGVEVAGAQSGTPAAAAGLAQGDVITAIGGQSVTSGTQITEYLVTHKPGDKVSLTWTDTSGQSHTANITLAAGPAA